MTSFERGKQFVSYFTLRFSARGANLGLIYQRMTEIVPAIIAKSFAELEQKIKAVEPFVQAVQLDIMDGVFVPNQTWPYFEGQNISDLEKIGANLSLEAHLMVARPDEVFDGWLTSPAKRVILHWEAMAQSSNIKVQMSKFIELAHARGKELGIALNPETPIEVLDEFVGKVDLVLLMSVNPGFAGQEFQEGVIPKIIALRQKYPDVKIEVDGGVNLKNVQKLKDAGADLLAVGSAIFNSSNAGDFIKEFSDLINN